MEGEAKFIRIIKGIIALENPEKLEIVMESVDLE